ncbi:MAG: HDOD domain-containing protein [Deltaproteobacteria bacterium]|nr:HDOD domain-containing protein [Deltaproteobacteria bacterium]MBW2340076.1 HDOD domain-containing protein [Deltaproteobacteria bacterium]
MRDVERIIEGIDTLRPIAYVGDKVMKIVSNPDCSFAELADVIKYDQAMTANLLRICNSTYFGLRKKIASIKQAVAYLGIERVACLLMMGNSADNLKNAQEGYDLNEGELWRYSVSSALIAQDLAEKKHLSNIPLLFTAALLKDIGKVILNTYVQESFLDIIKTVQNRGLTFIEAEKEVIGIDHAELGAKVAERWNFSPAMVNIIRNHHNPDKAPSDDLSIPIVYLADCICMIMGIGVGSDGLAYRYYQDVVDRLHFSEIDLQKTIANFREKLRAVEELVDVSRGDW